MNGCLFFWVTKECLFCDTKTHVQTECTTYSLYPLQMALVSHIFGCKLFVTIKNHHSFSIVGAYIFAVGLYNAFISRAT